MSTLPAPLKITIYGVNDEIKKEVTRSIIPWGILERAMDIQEEFENVEVGANGMPILKKEQVQLLTDFVIFVFDDSVTSEEIKRGASLVDMFAIYQQIFAMVGKVMPKNPTPALTPAANLQKVRQGRKRKK